MSSSSPNTVETRAKTLFVNNNVLIEVIGPPENGFRWLQIAGLRVYSVYWSPAFSVTLASFTDFLTRLELSIRTSDVPVVLVKSPVWRIPRRYGDFSKSVRRKHRESHIRQGGSETHIDISFVSDAITQRLTG